MRTNAKVYVMRAVDGALKIGHSRDPMKRAKQLDREVEIVHETEVLEHAERTERLAHRVLSLRGCHIRGEWFRADLQDAILAIETAMAQSSGAQLALGGRLRRTPRRMTSGHEGLDLLLRVCGSRKRTCAILDVPLPVISFWMERPENIPEYVSMLAELLETVPPKEWPERWRQ